MFRAIHLFLLLFILIGLLIPYSAMAWENNFVSVGKQASSVGMNTLGIGYYNEAVTYQLKNIGKDEFFSNYQGWFLKYSLSWGNNYAVQAQYLQANGLDTLTSLSGSLLYGLNLSKPGIGLYVGIAYSMTDRHWLGREQLFAGASDKGLEYPIGIRIQNPVLTFNIESRYQHKLPGGDDVSVKAYRYPLYFSMLMSF